MTFIYNWPKPTILNGTLEKSGATLENVVVTSTGRRNNLMSANRTGSVTNVNVQQINRLPLLQGV
jgi:hypothetical protein